MENEQLEKRVRIAEDKIAGMYFKINQISGALTLCRNQIIQEFYINDSIKRLLSEFDEMRKCIIEARQIAKGEK